MGRDEHSAFRGQRFVYSLVTLAALMVGGCLSSAGSGQVASPMTSRQEVRQEAGTEALSNPQKGIVNVQTGAGRAERSAPTVESDTSGAGSSAVTTLWQGLDRNTLLLLIGVTILISQLVRDTVRGMFRMVVQLVGVRSSRRSTPDEQAAGK